MYRAVEGQVHFWWVGLGNIIGATILAYYWDSVAPWLATDYDKVNLLDTFGPTGGLLVTYGLLAFAFILLLMWEKRFFRRKTVLTLSPLPHIKEHTMNTENTAIVPDYRLDMVGEPCPYPAVATLEAMPSLKPGEIRKW